MEALWPLLSLTLWPVQGVAMEGDPTHVQGLSFVFTLSSSGVMVLVVMMQELKKP